MVRKIHQSIALCLVLPIFLTACGKVQSNTDSDIRGADVNTKLSSEIQNAANSVVVFPDRQMETSVRAAMVYPTGNITVEMLSGLKFLTLRNASIVSINGIENCTSLTELNLADNKIVDISILANLTSLKTLFLASNKIVNISPLQNLTGLTTLHLYNNRIADISSLSNLVNLQWLELSENKITNIAALSGLTQLTWLYMQGNALNTSPNTLINNSVITKHKTRGCAVGY